MKIKYLLMASFTLILFVFVFKACTHNVAKPYIALSKVMKTVNGKKRAAATYQIISEETIGTWKQYQRPFDDFIKFELESKPKLGDKLIVEITLMDPDPGTDATCQVIFRVIKDTPTIENYFYKTDHSPLCKDLTFKANHYRLDKPEKSTSLMQSE